MKTRTDFVTNSSSSSFIIAKRSDLTGAEIEKFIKDRSDVIYNILDSYNEFTDYPVQPPKAKAEILNAIMELEGSMEIGDWRISCGTANGEDGDIFDLFMYNIGEFSGDKLKVSFE